MGSKAGEENKRCSYKIDFGTAWKMEGVIVAIFGEGLIVLYSSFYF